MSFSDFAALCTAVSGIAATVSLVYLAIQIHQNTKHTKALLQQGQANRVVATLAALANTDLATAWAAGNGGTTPEAVKRIQLGMICNAFVYDMADFHNQYVDGLVRGEQFGHACVGYRNLLKQPGMRAYWEGWRKDRLEAAPKFIAWVDELAGRADPSPAPAPSQT